MATTTQGTITPQGTVNYDPNTGAKLSAGQTVNVNQGNSTIGAIPTTALSTPQTPIIPVTPTVPDFSTMGANANAYTGNSMNEATKAEGLQKQNEITQLNEKQTAVGALADMQSSIGGKGQDTLNAYNQVDATGNSVNSLAGKLRSINAQSQALSLDTLAKQQAEINKATGQNITSTAVSRNTADTTRENLINTAKLAMESAIVKADYDTAKSFADQIVEAKYAQKLADIEAAKTNLDNIKDNLTGTQKKLADATAIRLEKEKQAELDKKSKENAINTVAMEAAKAGATPDVQKLISSIANDPTKSVADAILAAGPSLRTPNTEVIKLGGNAAYLIDKTTGKIIKSFAGSTGTGSGTITNPKYAGIVSTILGSGKFTKDQTAQITKAINNGEDPAAVIRNQGKALMTGANQTKVENYEAAKSSMQDLQTALNQFYANGGKTNIMSGNYEKVINKLGEVNDPKLVELATQIASQLQVYRNAISGTAYSVQEGQDIASIFPGINKTEGLNQAIINGRMKAFDSSIDGAYVGVLGNAYNQLKSAQETGLPKGIMDDRTYVEKAVKSQSIPYQDLVNNTPAGTIPVVDNKTGEVGYVPVSEFKASQYTKL